MSLGVVIKGPEGLVLAAESRVTLTSQYPDGTKIQVNFDNATKILSFSEPHTYVGVVTYGLAGVGLRTAYSYLTELEELLPKGRASIYDFAKILSDFFIKQWKLNMPMPPDYKDAPMILVVGGFNDKEPYGRVYLMDIPFHPEPIEQNEGNYGITIGGQREIADRLLQGFDGRLLDILAQQLELNNDKKRLLSEAVKPLQMEIPLGFISLQDYVHLAIFFIRATIDAQKFIVGIRGCGGPIDVCTITRRDGLIYVQRKKIIGEEKIITGGE
jgi:hypothetical protein